MSLATAAPQKLTFLTRFERVWTSLRSFQVRQGLAWSFLTVALGLITLASADYVWELSLRMRAAGLAAMLVLVLAVLWARVIAPLRWWTKPRTAAEIESRFPQLGQRIRTVVQYAGLSDELIDLEGVTPSLVGALEEETEIQAQPLPLDRLVPWWRVRALAALAAVPALVLLIAAVVSPEYRIAIERALLSRRPYTTLAITPGNITVDQGESVPITVLLKGRLKRDVVLYTRLAGKSSSSWQTTALDVKAEGSAGERESQLEKVKEPIEYRVTAGPTLSPTYLIGIRYPLALKSFDVDLKPPAYTGVAPSSVKGGDLRVIEGTTATFQITFDSPPAEAVLVVTDPSVRSKKDKTEPSRSIPLKPEGDKHTTNLNLTKDLVYQIAAKTPDGRALAKNSYKINVLEDRPPRVSFDEPDEALEVHPIAEVLNRIHVADDFGLARAGIVFQFNAGNEQTLVARDFKSEPGKLQTTSALQEMLLLEKLSASPTDSLSYSAFAEDNYPAGARRTETELRYIDIRPFKREYKLAESADGMEEADELTTLAELIARQRFNLNRANRLAKRKPFDKTIAEDPIKITGFEETLAGLTREFTEGVEGIVGQRIEPLHAAEEAMLGSIAALDHGQNAQAPPHMLVAVRHLIEARNTLQVLIGQDPAMAKAMRGFDRSQRQKIRKPKKETEEAEEIVAELEALAQDEDFVYATLSSIAMEQQEANLKGGQEGETNEGDAETKKNDPEAKKKKDADAEKKGDAEKKDGADAKKKNDGDSETKGEPDAAQKGDAEAEKSDGPDAEKKDGAGDKKTGNQAKNKSQKATKGAKGKGQGEGPGQGTGNRGEKDESVDQDTGGEPKKNTRREVMERQDAIADKARELEEKLKKLEVASELAKARMAKAAETTEKASGALTRGNSKEATEKAKAGAAMLHELARQVKGEIARDVAQELAMARDLADELADRAAEMGEQGSPGDDGQAPSDSGGKGANGRGDSADLTAAERLDRLQEAGKTLEQWLKDASGRAEGKSAERIRELLTETDATEIVEHIERLGEVYLGGKKTDAKREAGELARMLEVVARQLDVLHQAIIAPELAALVEFDKRITEITDRLKTLTTDADISEWHRLAGDLIHDLEKAGLTDAAAALTGALEEGGWHNAGGHWRWTIDARGHRFAPIGYTGALKSVTIKIHEKIQGLILRDMAAARDEQTPPEFKEMVDRYYKVLSTTGSGK